MIGSAEARSRATIEDVASLAFVSVATVSRALRGLPNVSEATRERVRAAAAQLNYRPHPSASRLASGQSRNISVVVPILNSWYFSEALAGAEAVLSDAGYTVSITAVSSSEQRRSFVADAVATRGSDGLLIVDLPLDDSEIAMLAESPLAVSTCGFDSGSFPSVVVDNIEIGRIATQHLVERGHRRIGALTGQYGEQLRLKIPADRVAGFEGVIADAGMELDPALMCEGSFSIAGGHDAMRQLLELPTPPSAVFAMSDDMAFGAMWAIREAGMTIPGDVAIVGVDGHEMCDVVGLTSVDQGVVRHGAISARSLVTMIEKQEHAVDRTEIEPRLVVRGST